MQEMDPTCTSTPFTRTIYTIIYHNTVCTVPNQSMTHPDWSCESLLLHDVNDVADDAGALDLFLTSQGLHPRLQINQDTVKIPG
jgi:hypothetical protein